MMVSAAFAVAFASAAQSSLLDEVRDADVAADEAVAAIRTPDDLKAKQAAWRAWWLDALGGMPEWTPLNSRITGTFECDGFRMENIVFESQPGVYVTAHLAMPTAVSSKPPYPVVLMPLGHSDAGILNPRYAAHLAMSARAGFAAFAWDPISQGERRQATDRKYDYTDNCSTEHCRLGARAWLVGWNFARFRIWDAVRAIDYVKSRADLDCSKLGIMGTSGGGTMSSYMQAFDPRIKVAFPNCYVSSLREVIRERGCHDAEQFFWNMLPNGFNHAAILAMGQPRVALATGSRWKDYFPHAGAVSTFAVFINMTARLGFDKPYWHFSCDGPHGLPPSTRSAQVDWMRHCIMGANAPMPLDAYRAMDCAGTDNNDPDGRAPLPFPAEAQFCTSAHQVRDMPGFRSVYDVIADEAVRLAKLRRPHSREELREIVRRRANIRPLAELGEKDEANFDHPYRWWYLEGREGMLAENHAAILAMMGRSRVGVKAEAILRDAARRVAANGGRPIVLEAKGADCIAAAHASAAEPQLFSSVRFSDAPQSWTEMATNPDPRFDSFAVAVWGALREYDWTELTTNASVLDAKAEERRSWRPRERWIGVNLPYCLYHKETRTEDFYKEEDFRFVKELGLNFVRLPLDYRCWMSENDWNALDESKLLPLDKCLEYGEKYGLHIQFCFHRAPGYSVNENPPEKSDLFRNKEAYAACECHWRFFARRWKNVPNERLSFNLINEPDESENVADVELALVKAIHEEDPKRFVVCDGMSHGQRPVVSLESYRGLVGQSCRGYFPKSISHYKCRWMGEWTMHAVPRWPVFGFTSPLYGPVKASLSVPLRIENAPAGDWTVRLGTVSGRCRFEVREDGKSIASREYVPAVGSADFTEIKSIKQWRLVRGRPSELFSFKLRKPVETLSFEVSEGDWIEVERITVASPWSGKRAELVGDYRWGVRENERPFRFAGWNAQRQFVCSGFPDDGCKWLEEKVFGEWKHLSERGTFVFVGECGATGAVSYPIYLAWMADQLKTWKKLNFGFAMWSLRGPFGLIDTRRKGAVESDFHGHKLDKGLHDLILKYK